MATRRVPQRPAAQPSESGPIEFKNILRESALDVRDVPQASASILYNLCRAKANQVMMMKRRGYTIPPEEEIWIQCSMDEGILIQKIRQLLGMKLTDLIRKEFNRSYTLTRSVIPSQTAYTYYPYLERDGDESLKMGEFLFRNGQWELVRFEDDIVEQRSSTTDVLFLDNLSSFQFDLSTNFSAVSRKIVVHMGNEDSFQKELDNMVVYRRQGVEIFHMSELFIDYFQHWLVPQQEIVKDVDKVRLLSSHLMIRDGQGVFKKVPNSKITETGLPYVHYTDIVMRYIGALPGDVIYWENDSYISSFITKEFGYMYVVGHKYSSLRQAEDSTFPGERGRSADEVDNDEDDDAGPEEEEVIEDDNDDDDIGIEDED
jgi:DNA-directed RNA polymerase subunit H (RpoH/RPB5)